MNGNHTSLSRLLSARVTSLNGRYSDIPRIRKSFKPQGYPVEAPIFAEHSVFRLILFSPYLLVLVRKIVKGLNSLEQAVLRRDSRTLESLYCQFSDNASPIQYRNIQCPHLCCMCIDCILTSLSIQQTICCRSFLLIFPSNNDDFYDILPLVLFSAEPN